jgi:glutathione peroxidase
MGCCISGRFGLAVFGVVGLIGAAGVVAQQEAPKPDPAPAPAPAPADSPDMTPAPKSPLVVPAPAPTDGVETLAADPYVLGHTVNDIDGKAVDLASFKGQVVLIVNVASKCGFTPQYLGLEALYQEKKTRGFAILAFPANDFMGQEPGTNAEIKEFCTGEESKFKVTFPLFEKISVKGDQIHPLYKQLTEQPSPVGGDVGWNFTKYLVDREGEVVARFDSRVKPDDAAMNKRIDELLGAGAAGKAEEKGAGGS